MSGPKTSNFSLTAEQRRILAEQRRIQRETQKASMMLKKSVDELRGIIARVDKELAQYKNLVEETNDSDNPIDALEKNRNDAITVMNEAGLISVKSGLQAMKFAIGKLKNTAKSLIADEEKRLSEIKEVEADFKTRIDSAVDDAFTISFMEAEEIPLSKSSDYLCKINSALEEIRGLYLSPELSANFEKLKDKAAEIEDKDYADNYYVVSVVPFLKLCRRYNSEYMEKFPIFENLYLEYQLLSDELGLSKERYEFSLENMDKLDRIVTALKKKINEVEEQKYIHQCVDTAMKEMGYRIIGDREVIRKNGNKYKNELFLFDEGTAVNVTYSDSGTITMELGGLDRMDRVPSDSECQSLSQDMIQFCDDYKTLEKKLIQMGVTTQRISILPPDEQYAQIINISDYNINEDTIEYYQSKSAHKAATTKNYLRRDG